MSTRVGGVPEVLPDWAISFSNCDEDGAAVFRLTLYNVFELDIWFADLVRALGEAIHRVSAGLHDPALSYTLIKDFYSWAQVAERTEVVYGEVLKTPPRDFWERFWRWGVEYQKAEILSLTFSPLRAGRTRSARLLALSSSSF